MNTQIKNTMLIIAIGILLSTSSLQARSSTPLENIRLQLRWHHQFQFAGYYAAKHKGFYRDAGFEVEIIAGSPERQPVTELLKGNVDFAEGNSEVLYARLQGEPLVALAAILQRSPSILLTRSDHAINNVNDLRNKKIMLVDGKQTHDADLLAMLRTTKTPIDTIHILPSSYDISDLLEGRVDAFNAYLSNEPFFFESQNITYHALKPSDYGIDFYSDILFTSEKMAAKSPQKVTRFINASLKGWQYALDHPEEIIQLLKQQNLSTKSLNHLRFEANTIRELILPELISIGHMHPQRFQHMAETFQQLGMIDNLEHLEGFIFDPSTWQERVFQWLPYIGIIMLLMSMGLCVQAYTNRKLEAEISRRLSAEDELKRRALTDPLTQLHNFRSFHQQLASEFKRSQRSKQPFSLLSVDIDFFKGINDQYGHQMGDEVLVHLAAVLTKNLRESDICARIGGEEFVIILPDTPETHAIELAERARKNVDKAPFHRGEVFIGLTVSVGVTEWKLFDQTDEILERAEQALYRAKRSGRNCTKSFRLATATST